MTNDDFEVYEPDEQIIYTDKDLVEQIETIKIIQKNLTRKIIVSDLDRDDSIDLFMKIEFQPFRIRHRDTGPSSRRSSTPDTLACAPRRRRPSSTADRCETMW